MGQQLDATLDDTRANYEGDSGKCLSFGDSGTYLDFFALVRVGVSLRDDGFDAVRGCAFFGLGALPRFLAGGTVSSLTTVLVISSCVCLIFVMSLSVAFLVHPAALTNDLK